MQQRIEPKISSTDVGDIYRSPTGHTRNEPVNEPRRPWIALWLGFFIPPVAFAYVGRPFLGIALNLLVLVVLFVLGATGLVQSVAGAWSIYGVAIVFTITIVLLPWLFARKARRRYAPAWFNQWYVYLLFVATAAPFAYVLLNKDRVFGFATYRVPTASMAPTIDVGDMVTADARAATLAALKTNDVVVYRSSNNPEIHFVKRIVAMPGQQVHIDSQGLKIDGAPEHRIAAVGNDLMLNQYMRYADVTLGPDEFYVLGDNRDNSVDSRTDGPVKQSSFVARATTIFYSRDPRRVGPIH